MTNKKAFTLLEVLISMLILAGVIVVLSSSWSASLLRVRKSRQLNTTALLLQRKVTEMELKYKGKSLEEVKEDDEGDFGDEYPNYRWKMKVQKMELPDIASGMSAKKDGVTDVELTMIKTLTEYIKSSIREMKVSVFYKGTGSKNSKEVEYAITTYLVDYDKDLPLSGM